MRARVFEQLTGRAVGACAQRPQGRDDPPELALRERGREVPARALGQVVRLVDDQQRRSLAPGVQLEPGVRVEDVVEVADDRRGADDQRRSQRLPPPLDS